jgi:Protein of unknown function (DUF3050)
MAAQLHIPTARSLHLADLIEELVRHPVYALIRDEAALRRFMASHVFCVWDFQSLLKALQRRLTCVEIPWLPSDDPEARRLINEIVLDEESDAMPDGGYLSHFELYLRAMQSCGADTGPILRFTQALRDGLSVEDALGQTVLPAGVAPFVANTLRIAQSAEVHQIAAAFTYGREDVIPSMFQQMVASLAGGPGGNWELFLLYLNRHIEHDGERHGPLSRALVARLCGQDDRLWREAEQTARASIRARLDLWDHIAAVL